MFILMFCQRVKFSSWMVEIILKCTLFDINAIIVNLFNFLLPTREFHPFVTSFSKIVKFSRQYLITRHLSHYIHCWKSSLYRQEVINHNIYIVYARHHRRCERFGEKYYKVKTWWAFKSNVLYEKRDTLSARKL